MTLWFAPLAILFATVTQTESHEHSHNHGHKGCGTAELSQDLIAEDARHMEKWTRKKKTRRQTSVGSNLCVGCIDIEMYFHIFSDGQPPKNSDGDPTSEQLFTFDGISHQVEVLNRQFSKSPFQFTLLATFRTTNATLANANEKTAGPLIEEEIHTRRRGGKNVINVYWYAGSCDTECGEATFPRDAGIFPTNLYDSKDFVEMCPECMASELLDENNPTLTHEIGHWLGLFHTFAGETCDPLAPGDMVDDTPQQSRATNSTVCNDTQDSCPLLPGFDPTDNYMDYSPDMCQERFTIGQMERMWAQWNEYRALSPSCNSDAINVNIEMRFGSGPLTDESFLQIADKNDAAESLVLMTDENRNMDYSGLKGSYGACVAEKHLHEMYLQVKGHTITSSFFVSLELGGAEVYRTQEGEGLFYFFVDQADCGSKGTFTFEMESDDYKSETTWRVLDSEGSVVIQDPFSSIRFKAKYFSQHCLGPGQYTFEITDSASDGIETPGFYSISFGSKEIERGGAFSASDSAAFKVGTLNTLTKSPSPRPSSNPTVKPSQAPIKTTDKPTRTPTQQPTTKPSEQPTTKPSEQPTMKPSDQPTTKPSDQPTMKPSDQPTTKPTMEPTPRASPAPSFSPSSTPVQATIKPIAQTSTEPSLRPSQLPTELSSSSPTSAPQKNPTGQPSSSPAMSLSTSPSAGPTQTPIAPKASPTPQPVAITANPTSAPSVRISASPSGGPSSARMTKPTTMPNEAPSMESPSSVPTLIAGDPSLEEPTAGTTGVGTSAPIAIQRATNSPTTEVIPQGGSVCFSGNTIVRVQGYGEKLMGDVKIGDMVQISDGEYEPVYSFCKRLDNEVGSFVRIVTTHSSAAPLELSPNHFIFKHLGLTEKPVPIQARMIRPGDMLIHTDGIKIVSQVELVQSRGVYAPYTDSGIIFVNGFQASVYASLEDDMGNTLLHFLQTHHRMICKTGLCHWEQYSEAGLSTISNYSLKLYSWWKGQNKPLRWLLQGLAFMCLGFLCFLEWLLKHFASFVPVLVVSWFLQWNKSSKR